jgi:S-(hydroxymethyl)glutathione dehydrogenase/alcohol dehydrogenase
MASHESRGLSPTGSREVNNVDDPKIQDPQDIIVPVTSTAICGSDLHIYNGFFPQLKDMIMGHEFMGVAEETWCDGHKLRKGDRVVVPFPVACGTCFFCQRGLPGHCENSNPKYYGPALLYTDARPVFSNYPDSL